ncbi:MAG TPA: 50S ribosomal protein L19 [Vampirovibrionales bacterium]
MRHKLLEEVEKSYLKESLPKLRVGETVKVAVKIKEGSKQRIQNFEGTLIAISGASTAKTIVVRKISSGVGVERYFLLHSPLIDSVTVTSKGRPKVRRAKLYYLRDRIGKKARIKYKVS